MKRRLNRSILASAGTALMVMAQPVWAQAYQPTDNVATSATADVALAHPELWPQLAWPAMLTPQQEARVQALLAAMDLPCKVGQILQPDLGAVTPEDVTRYHLGSVLNGGDGGPGKDDRAPPPAWLALADAFYDASMKSADGCPAIPVMWGIDAVHGQNNIIGATLFPQNIGLGATRDGDLVERIGAATAQEIQVTGQDWTFAPTLAVPQDFRWGRTFEGYSSDPALVTMLGARMIRGLQGPVSTKPMLQNGHVAATAKHYLGDGGTRDGRDQGDTRVSEDLLRWAYGTPYAAAIEEGVASVMASYSSWNGVKMHGNKSLLDDVLKQRMGFGGMIVTDWNGHAQIKGCTAVNCPQALAAGVDMFMIPTNWKTLYDNLIKQAKDGTIAMARLDDAVARTLRMKIRLGLFEAGRPSARPFGGKWDVLGSPEHRALAREAVRKSLVLLKNDGVLPLKPSARILVAGDAADDVARQSGGWTVSWQGTGLSKAHLAGSTSIWAGLADAVRAAGGSAELSVMGDYKTRPDVAIVVFGETPYAEGVGDIPSLQLRAELNGPLETMKRLRAQGIKVVAVMLSGRPLFVNAQLNAANGFVAAWLPGSEGAGVADMLFAKDGADFTGRLPMAWPISAKAGAPALFGHGYGLTMAQPPQPWKELSEDAQAEPIGMASLYLDKGIAQTGWTLASKSATLRPAKDLIQPGARQIIAKGSKQQPAMISLTSDKPLDWRREAFRQPMVVMTIKMTEAAGSNWSLALKCETQCGKSVALAETAMLSDGQWHNMGVPLRCFGLAQTDLNKVTAPFSLSIDGRATFSLSRIMLGTVADIVATCPN